MTKLTKYLREQIAQTLAIRKYLAEKIRLSNQLDELAERIYQDIVQKNNLDTTNHVRAVSDFLINVQYPNGVNYQHRIHNNYFIFVLPKSYDKNTALATYPADHPYIKALLTYQEKRNNVISRQNFEAEQIYRQIGHIKSFTQLRAEHPEIYKSIII